jgi:hypothetical protein
MRAEKGRVSRFFRLAPFSSLLSTIHSFKIQFSQSQVVFAGNQVGHLDENAIVARFQFIVKKIGLSRKFFTEYTGKEPDLEEFENSFKVTLYPKKEQSIRNIEK